jgi:hypothetical protein
LIDRRAELDLDVVESAAQRGIDGGVARKYGSGAGVKKDGWVKNKAARRPRSVMR